MTDRQTWPTNRAHKIVVSGKETLSIAMFLNVFYAPQHGVSPPFVASLKSMAKHMCDRHKLPYWDISGFKTKQNKPTKQTSLLHAQHSFWFSYFFSLRLWIFIFFSSPTLGLKDFPPLVFVSVVSSFAFLVPELTQTWSCTSSLSPKLLTDTENKPENHTARCLSELWRHELNEAHPL